MSSSSDQREQSAGTHGPSSPHSTEVTDSDESIRMRVQFQTTSEPSDAQLTKLQELAESTIGEIFNKRNRRRQERERASKQDHDGSVHS